MRGRVSVLKASASCEDSNAKFRSWKRYITKFRHGITSWQRRSRRPSYFISSYVLLEYVPFH